MGLKKRISKIKSNIDKNRKESNARKLRKANIRNMYKSSDIKDLTESTKEYVNWIQEFSKKIVAVTFLIFVIINLFILVIVALCYFNTGELMYLDTLISEANTTFRDVIGGYIIKAATENAIKIAGAAVQRYLEYKMNHEYPGIDNIISNSDYIPDEEDPDNDRLNNLDGDKDSLNDDDYEDTTI